LRTRTSSASSSLTSQGIQLFDIYKGSERSALRLRPGWHRKDEKPPVRVIRNEEIERRQRELDRKKRIMENEIAMLKERFGRDEDEIRILIEQDLPRKSSRTQQEVLAYLRKAEK